MKSAVTSISSGHSTVSAQTSATLCARSRSTNSGAEKLLCRISTACRIAPTSSTVVHALPFSRESWRRANEAAASPSFGSSFRNARNRSAAKRILGGNRSEEHTSELQSLMRISYDGFCLKKKKKNKRYRNKNTK